MRNLIYIGMLCIIGTAMAATDATVFTSVQIDDLLIDDSLIIPVSTSAPASSVSATGTVTAAAAVALASGETVTINDQTYTFTTNTLSAANQIKIVSAPVGAAGHTNSVAMTNLFLAVTVGGTNNPTLYYSTTVKPANVAITKESVSVIKVASSSGYHGTIGNALPLLATPVAIEDGTNLTVSGSGTLISGTDGTVGDAGTIVLYSTGLYFTIQDSTAGDAVWTTK